MSGLNKLTRSGLTSYYVKDFEAATLTVSAPATAPTVSTPTVTLGTFGVQPGNTAFTAGNVYDVAITFNGKTGESLIGTSFASFTAATGQGLAVHPNAPDTTLAASANVYIRNTSGDNTWRRASDASGAIENNNAGFGDGDSAVGGYVCKYNGAGALPPGASTATKPDGSTALGETPNLAPTIKKICALLSTDGALFYSYSWVTQNGETDLSPFSSSVTAPSSSVGAWMPLYIPDTPPIGAVAIRVYAGTSATEGAMKLQVEAPIGFPRIPIHSFNSSGAAHVTSTPTSTIPSILLAYQMAQATGAGTIVVSEVIQTSIPLIFGNASGDKFGIRVVAEGVNNMSYTQTHGKVRIEYVGSKTSATGMVICDSTFKMENVELVDPNSRLKYGMVVSDFESGQGHNNTFNNVTIRAMEAGAIGICSVTNSANSTGHTSDNCVYDQCTVFADAWALDFSGNQTVEHQFRHFSAHVLNSGNKANSGVVRCATQNLHFDGISAAEVGHHFFYLTNEYLDPYSVTSCRMNADEVYNDSADTRKFCYFSPLDVNGSFILIPTLYNLNQTGDQAYGILIDNPGKASILSIYRNSSSVYNYSNSNAGQMYEGPCTGTATRTPWATRGSSAATYEKTLIELLCGALGFKNQGNELAWIQTDSSGNLLIAVQSGNDFRINVAGSLKLLLTSADLSATTPIDTTGRILIATNNIFYRGKTTSATEASLIGVNASDKVSVDPNALGAVFGGDADVTGVYKVDGTQVVSNQGAAVADASGGSTVDTEARSAINTLLARLRTHGLIAT